MPKQQPALVRLRKQIEDLPRLPGVVLEGGLRPLSLTVQDDGALIQPTAALWVESATGLVRAFQLINTSATPERQMEQVLGALCAACAHPIGSPPQRDVPATAATADGDAAGDADAQIVDLSAARAQRRQPRASGAAGAAGAVHARPGLPALIVAADRALADAARALVAPLGIAVEFQEHPAVFEGAATELERYLVDMAPAGSGPFEWDVDVSLLQALGKAVTGFHHRAPWTYFADTPPVRIELGTNGPEPGVATLYASVLGGGGMVRGVAFYYTVDDVLQAMSSGAAMEPAADEDITAMVEMLKQSGVPTDQLPPEMLREMVGTVLEEQAMGGSATGDLAQNSLAILFESRDEADPTYGAWLKDRGVKPPARDSIPLFVRTEVGHETRQPNDREVSAMTLALEALNQFCTRHRARLEGPFLPLEPLSLAVQLAAGARGTPAPVAVTYPPPEWDEAEARAAADDEDEVEEPELPATAAGAATAYRFRVWLETDEEVWRRLELRGDQTLHDLHKSIQAAFGWDDDHEYAFYLSGDYYDESSAYGSPGGADGSAARHRLEHLPLRAPQRFVYLFDFGDEWRHEIALEQIAPDGVTAGVIYPRITARHGESPEQYPALDEEEDLPDGDDTD